MPNPGMICFDSKTNINSLEAFWVHSTFFHMKRTSSSSTDKKYNHEHIQKGTGIQIYIYIYIVL